MKGETVLYLAFLWHMHQPYYKDLVTGEYCLPWVRLHGIKDYYDMAAILEDFPSIHQTFNLVPSLMEQIQDYASGTAQERFLELSERTAAELSHEERAFVLKNFFMANPDTMIRIHPRYGDLLEKRGFPKTGEEIQEMIRYFSVQDLLDLQVWFNLAWFDPSLRERDPLLRGLVEKGRGYTEQEKRALLRKQGEVLGLIIPTYQRLAEKGQIEVTTTPYYHPILPLLCDTDSAKLATPRIKLPEERFVHPEDAAAQLSMAIEFHKMLFGRAPYGMWPAEGAVSEAIVPLLFETGIHWIASDEGVLARSINRPMERDSQGRLKSPEVLYQPYRLEKGGKGLTLVFRDRYLSDLIGFTYSRWAPKAAVDDFLGRLRDIRIHYLKKLVGYDERRPPLVAVILDGENAWEYYPNDGRDFLLKLYERLSEEPGIRTVTVSEYLERYPPTTVLPKLHAGSWINANFRIWIGQEEDNEAWDLLSMVRSDLEDLEAARPRGEKEKGLSRAWQEIYIAEGSDWCWWYGDEHTSGNDEEFDNLFRQHLMNVYRITGKEIPPRLYIPILRGRKKGRLTQEPLAFITPHIDGEVTNYFEWLSAGLYDASRMGAVMHPSEGTVRAIYFGFNLKNMFLRLDFRRGLKDIEAEGLVFYIHFLAPTERRIELGLSAGKVSMRVFRDGGLGQEPWVEEPPIGEAAAGDIIELAIPFERLEASPDQEVQFIVSVKGQGQELERWPPWGYLSFRVPTEDFEATMWQV
ncbi:MAG: hypothetical protein HY998_05920 [candidate division NC10 bacterium]|nr:hypothetical protein [candidate division NC10 bacterium]